MNKEIHKLLSSGKTEDILKGLKMVEKNGSIKELPLVCELLNHSDVNFFEAEVIDLISNIRIPEANQTIVEFIKKNKIEKKSLKSILQCCWQSQLNFSQNIKLFTEIFIEGDVFTALEAFTLIENIWLDYSFDSELQSHLLNSIKNEIETFDETKLALANELILILEAESGSDMEL